MFEDNSIGVSVRVCTYLFAKVDKAELSTIYEYRNLFDNSSFYGDYIEQSLMNIDTYFTNNYYRSMRNYQANGLVYVVSIKGQYIEEFYGNISDKCNLQTFEDYFAYYNNYIIVTPK